MTMYPFLTGFWISAGMSSAVLFMLMYWQQKHHHSLHTLPAWCSAAIVALIFISPLIGIAYTWFRVSNRRRHSTVRFTHQRCLYGALVGGIIILIASCLLLPLIQN